MRTKNVAATELPIEIGIETERARAQRGT